MGKLNLVLSDEGKGQVIDDGKVYDIELPGKNITIDHGPTEATLIMTVQFICRLKPAEEPIVDFEEPKEEPRF